MKTTEAISKFITYCKNKKLSPRTIAWYTTFLKIYAEKFEDLPSKPEDIEAFIAGYNSGDERRHGCYRALRCFYGFLFKRCDIPNPFEKIDGPKVSHKEKPSLTLDELRKLVENPENPKAITALFHLYSDTGCRCSEAYDLKRSAILGNRVILDGKTGQRVVPISPTTRKLLLSLKPEDFKTNTRQKIFNSDPDRVFHWSKQTEFEEVAAALRRAGLNYASPNHLFRHSFVSLYKGNIMALRAITGHSDFKILQRYYHKKIDDTVLDHINGSPLAQIGKNGMGQIPDNINNVDIRQMDTGDKILIAVPTSLAFKGFKLNIQLSEN